MTIDGVRLEYAWHGPGADERTTLVLLHEGLGCVAMWRDFPAKLAEETGCGVLVYSRKGYGGSDPVAVPRPLSYMHDEAFHVLGPVLDHWGIGKAILVGHSDGASIATIYAGGVSDARVRGLALLAPHFFVEDITIAGIEAARQAYAETDLRARLARLHGANVDGAFHGWCDAWLDPAFRAWDITEYLAYIRVPMLIVQGRNDNYGTIRQIGMAQAECYCPVEAALLDDCGHSPHRDQPESTLKEIAAFVRQLVEVHAEQVEFRDR